MEKSNRLPARGMRDFDPVLAEKRIEILGKIISCYQRFGFGLIETPVVEKLDNLIGSKGGENEKLIFKILKRGAELDQATQSEKTEELADLGLRYDLTVPLSRFYANNAHQLSKPFKVFQIGSVWRAERPQKSRYRQFTQCDIDIIGDKSINADLELIQATAAVLNELNVPPFTVRLNDRQLLAKMGEAFHLDDQDYREFLLTLDKLDKKDLESLMAELESKITDRSKATALSSFLKNLTTKRDEDAFAFLKDQLKIDDKDDVFRSLQPMFQVLQEFETDIPMTFDPTLVRGMDYYTGPIYEISTTGQNFSIAGGGRYDKLIGTWLGTDVPSCGFSIGFERIIDILTATETGETQGEQKNIALIYSEKTDPFPAVWKEAQKLRAQGLNVSIHPKQKNFSNQIATLKKIGTHQHRLFKKEI